MATGPDRRVFAAALRADSGGEVAGSGLPRLMLKLLAPYAAVLVFWVGLGSAWLAILAYHAQILLWVRGSPDPFKGPRSWRFLALAAPAAIAGPLVYVLLPRIAGGQLSPWLTGHGLQGVSLWLMVPYFGVVHPVLEQLFWAPLRAATPVSHVAFAGYHVIVMWSLLPVAWLGAVFAALVVISVAWREMEQRAGGLTVPMASHLVADLGIVLAAVALS